MKRGLLLYSWEILLGNIWHDLEDFLLNLEPF